MFTTAQHEEVMSWRWCPRWQHCAEISRQSSYNKMKSKVSYKISVPMTIVLSNSHIHEEKCCMKIVYYAPREEKTWTSEPKARVTNTGCGLANFTPVERILFFVIVSVKSLLYACTAGRKVCTLRVLWRKINFYNL